MTWQELVHSAVTYLEAAGVEQPAQVVKFWLADLYPSSQNRQQEVGPSDLAKAEEELERLAMREPLSYVTQVAHFYGLKLLVNEHTLIPRPETEELVRWILERETDETLRFADVCTGTGCIAAALGVQHNGWTGICIDVGASVLDIAKLNFQAYALEERIETLEADVIDELDYLGSEQSVDFVVANPPYIPDADWLRVDPMVSMWEPHMALRVTDAKPLIFYDDIALAATTALRPGGRIYFECNDLFTGEVAFRLKKEGYKDVEIFTDMQGKPRHVAGVWPGA